MFLKGFLNITKFPIPTIRDYSFNILVVGNAGVGKSSLVHSWILNKCYCICWNPPVYFNPCRIPTGQFRQVETFIKLGSQNVRLFLTVAPGQSSVENQIPNYAHEVHGVLFVYSLHPSVSKRTFDNIFQVFVPMMNQHCRRGYHAGVVATKSDLPDAVSTVAHKKKAADMGFLFTKVSAKTCANIAVPFHSLANKILQTCLAADATNKIPPALRTKPRRYGPEPESENKTLCRTT